MRQPGEPSIEEILESIKRVIARQDPVPAFRAFGNDGEHEDPAGDDPVDDDVLDLSRANYAAQPPADPARLVTEDVSRATRGSLDALAGAVEHGGAAPAAPSDNGALEALLRELLRPALADWLDRNLPAIVERMVASEIARITGRR